MNLVNYNLLGPEEKAEYKGCYSHVVEIDGIMKTGKSVCRTYLFFSMKAVHSLINMLESVTYLMIDGIPATIEETKLVFLFMGDAAPTFTPNSNKSGRY